jgi:hypothetical protein
MKVSLVSHVTDRFGGRWCKCRMNCHRSEGGGGGGLPSSVVWLDTKLLCLTGPRSSSVTVLIGLRAGVSGFDSRQGHNIFVFTEISRPAVGSIRPPIQELLLILSPRVNLMGPEVISST